MVVLLGNEFKTAFLPLVSHLFLPTVRQCGLFTQLDCAGLNGWGDVYSFCVHISMFQNPTSPKRLFPIISIFISVGVG